MNAPQGSDELDRLFDLVPAAVPENLRAPLDAVLRCRARLRRSERRIVFFGAFKSGTSSLINALLGAPLLPARANRATAVPTVIRYGAALEAAVLREDARGELAEQSIPLDDIARSVLLDVSGAAPAAPPGVRRLDLRLPLPWLERGWALVDTPSLLEGVNRGDHVLDALEDADLAVMALAADRLLSDREKQLAQTVSELLNGNVIFAVNRLGLVEAPERDAVLAWARQGLGGAGNQIAGRPLVIGVDARAALETRRRFPWGAEDGGRGALEKCLRRLISSRPGERTALLSRLGILGHRLDALDGECRLFEARARQRLEALHAAEAERRRAELARQREQIALARGGVAAIRAALAGRGEAFVRDCARGAETLAAAATPTPTALNSVLRSAVATYARGLRQDLQAAVASLEIVVAALAFEVDDQFYPARVLAGLGGWLVKSRLSGDFKAAVGEQMRGAAGRLRPLLQAEAERYVAELEEGLAALADRVPEAESVSAAMSEAERSARAAGALRRWGGEFRAAVAARTTTLLGA